MGAQPHISPDLSHEPRPVLQFFSSNPDGRELVLHYDLSLESRYLCSIFRVPPDSIFWRPPDATGVGRARFVPVRCCVANDCFMNT